MFLDYIFKKSNNVTFNIIEELNYQNNSSMLGQVDSFEHKRIGLSTCNTFVKIIH
jgi:hypothetical protein